MDIDDPQIKVTIEADGDILISGAGPQEFRLRPGSYRWQASKDGKPVKSDVVTITRGGKQVVRVRLEPAAVPFAFKPPPPGPLDRLDPAKIPAEERFAWQPKELVRVLGDHRGRHWGDVATAAFSPDGKLIASSGTDAIRPLGCRDAARARRANENRPLQRGVLARWAVPPFRRVRPIAATVGGGDRQGSEAPCRPHRNY